MGTTMAVLLHEVWQEPDGKTCFCLAGPMGADARRLLEAGSKRIWTVEAGSHFEAMTKYYDFMGWGEYSTDQEWDRQPYPQDWRDIQLKSESASSDD